MDIGIPINYKPNIISDIFPTISKFTKEYSIVHLSGFPHLHQIYSP